tara:strand:+ start:589 stop:768 length:180 start_codon:yes stop_codon:yes gene_type:complete
MKLYNTELTSYLNETTTGPSIYAKSEEAAKSAIACTKLLATEEIKEITICEQQGKEITA